MLLAALLTYATTVTYDYTWDDPPLVSRVQGAVSEGTVPQLLTGSFHVKNERSARYYRPVMLASLAGEVLLTGGAPWFSHLMNVLLHGINSVLVLLLLSRISGSRAGAFAGALLFAVHPVHGEAVAAVSSRMDLMALTLLLPAAIWWVSGKGKVQGRAIPSLLAVSLVYLLACFTKETAFMLPAALVAWQVVRRQPPDGRQVAGALAIGAAAATALAVRAAVFAREPIQAAGSVKAGAVLPDVTASAVWKILLINMRLAALPFPIRSHWAGTDLAVTGGTVAGALMFLALFSLCFRKSPSLALMGGAWWFVFTLPVLGIFNLGQVVAAERYAYIPSVGLCLLAGAVASRLAESRVGRPLLGLGAAMTAVLAGWTIFHTMPWKAETALYSHVLRDNPSYATAHLNHGVALVREGRIKEAMESYDKALELVPGWDMALFNRGNLFHRMGRNPEALADFETLLESNPGDWEASLNMGNVLREMGRLDEAEDAFRRAAQDSSDSGMPLVALALLSAARGNHGEALDIFQEAMAREPDLSEAHEGSGDSHAAQGAYRLAEEAYMRALELSPSNARAALKLGGLLMREGRHGPAIQAFRTAIAGDRSLVPAWAGLVLAYRASGKGYEADRLIRELDASDRQLAVRVRKAAGPGR